MHGTPCAHIQTSVNDRHASRHKPITAKSCAKPSGVIRTWVVLWQSTIYWSPPRKWLQNFGSIVKALLHSLIIVLNLLRSLFSSVLDTVFHLALHSCNCTYAAARAVPAAASPLQTTLLLLTWLLLTLLTRSHRKLLNFCQGSVNSNSNETLNVGSPAACAKGTDHQWRVVAANLAVVYYGPFCFLQLIFPPTTRVLFVNGCNSRTHPAVIACLWCHHSSCTAPPSLFRVPSWGGAPATVWVFCTVLLGYAQRCLAA